MRRLLSEYFDLVWRTACRLGATQERADDVAQEVFLIVSRRLERVGLEREKQFLVGVTVRVTANARRRAMAKFEIAGDLYGERHIDPSPRPDELLEHKQLRQVLDAILETLPDAQREVFVLSEIEGMSGPEVAAALDLPLGTVASRLHRARERYQAEVGRYRLRWTRASGGAR
jgi:RNA polymerase sigma-70 factor (ECF subfamily)